MRVLRKRAGLLVLPAALTVALVAAPSAGAAKVISKSKSTAIAGTNTIGTAIAKCPRGMAAVGGGFSSTPQVHSNPPSLLNVFESQRAGVRGWRVSAGQSITNGSGKLTAYVYCRKQKGQIKEVPQSQPLATAARSQATALATCPKGTKAIAGGFELPPVEPVSNGAATVFPTDSEKSGGRSWTVTGVRDNDAATAAGTVDAIAYCLPNASAKTKSNTASVTTNKNQDATAQAQTKACKRPTLASSGGFNAPFVQQGVDRAILLITETRRAGGGWQVAGYPLGSGAAETGTKVSLTAFAYCR